MNPAGQKRVLVAPLEWGLGHATRCVPIIRELFRQGAEIILAADGLPYRFFEQTFPGLKLIRLPGYDISYPKSGLLGLHLALRSGRISSKVKAERKNIERIVEENEIDIIISDNRFACRTLKTYNVYITHQLNVKAPFAEKFISSIHRKYYDKFDEIWVPDAEGKRNLSGDLGHLESHHPFVRYIGPLSRFADSGPWNSRPMKWWMVVMLSGPEPQRTILEEKIREELTKFSEETLVVRGLPGETEIPQWNLPHVHLINHPNDNQLKEALLSSHHVLCRPGYSTICDLSALGISPIVVPTPGQTEQEYLAAYHAEAGELVNIAQKNFKLSEAIRLKTQMKPMNILPEPELLSRRIRSILKR